MVDAGRAVRLAITDQPPSLRIDLGWLDNGKYTPDRRRELLLPAHITAELGAALLRLGADDGENE